MLTWEEEKKLQRLLAMMPEEGYHSPEIPRTYLDVSNRLRDQQGRFLPNESQSRIKEEYPSRSIRLVKVKDSYGTYLVKDQDSFERAIGAVCYVGIIAILAIIF